LNTEALQNIASIINSEDALVINNLTVTGTIKTDTISPYTTSSQTALTGGIKTDTISSYTATKNTTLSNLDVSGAINTDTISPYTKNSQTALTGGIKTDTISPYTTSGQTAITGGIKTDTINPYNTKNIGISAPSGSININTTSTNFTGGDVYASSNTFHAVNFEVNRSDGNFVCNKGRWNDPKYLCG
jgi:hypothetical protein